MRKAANAKSWKLKPFGAGVPLAYRTTLNAQQFELAQLGLIPNEMKDKWFVHYEEPYLYFHRSWTGLPIYRLKLEKRGNSAEVVEALLDAERAEQPGIDVTVLSACRTRESGDTQISA